MGELCWCARVTGESCPCLIDAAARRDDGKSTAHPRMGARDSTQKVMSIGTTTHGNGSDSNSDSDNGSDTKKNLGCERTP